MTATMLFWCLLYATERLETSITECKNIKKNHGNPITIACKENNAMYTTVLDIPEYDITP
jgi:hypothetical protein